MDACSLELRQSVLGDDDRHHHRMIAHRFRGDEKGLMTSWGQQPLRSSFRQHNSTSLPSLIDIFHSFLELLSEHRRYY